MTHSLYFFAAAAFEIAGCYAFWAWMRLGKHILWLIPGSGSLAMFALILTQVETEFAGRAYAAYGGVYIVASLAWLHYIERRKPLVWDIIGAVVCLLGAALILFGPRIAKI